MQRLFYIINRLGLILITVILTSDLAAYNNTKIPYNLVIKDSDVGFSNLTVNKTSTPGHRVPSTVFANTSFNNNSNLHAILNNINFSSSALVPDLATGTVSEFKNYCSTAELTESQILDWHAAYMSDSFIAIAKQLPGYRQKLTALKFEYGAQNKITEFFSSALGLQPKGFDTRINQLYETCNRELRIVQARAAQITQAKQVAQATVRQTWPENFKLLQQDIPEWQDLSEIFIEHKFGDSARLQKRIAVLGQCNNSNLNSRITKQNKLQIAGDFNQFFTTQNYSLSLEVNHVLRDTGLDHTDYTNCYGNPFQQLIHQENLDQLQQLGTLSPRSPIFYHKLAVAECIDAAREYNQAGLVHDGVQVTDMCWAIIDYGKAIGEGAIQGLILVAKDLIDHPEQALLLVVAGEYVLAYQIAKVTYEVAKIGFTAWQEPDQGRAEWDNYIAPVTELVNAFENNEISARDVLKTGTMVAVSCRAQGKLSSGLGKLCKVTKANALTYLKNNPHATPQLYMSTPDGKLLKATKLTGSERRNLRAQRAATQITEFMTELSDENFAKALKIATTDDKYHHFFGDDKLQYMKHNFSELVEKLGGKKNGGKENVVREVIMACIGKIPKDGEFKNISVRVAEYTVYVRGRVISGVPCLGTMFIK